jgi:hypothetical protein
MSSIPMQPVAPPLPAEQNTKPPWRPWVSGIAGLLLGPLSGGLIAFINFRRLGRPRAAAWTLALTIIGCALFGVLIVFAPAASNGIGRLIGNILSPLLYPFIQRNAFDEWAAAHPGTEPDKGWRSLGWAVLGCVLYFAVAIGAALGISPKGAPKNIEVRYAIPESVKVGETFAMTLTIRNGGTETQKLYSLDIDTHFLKGVSIVATTPAYRSIEPNALAPIRSYTYEQNIPANGTLEISLQAKATEAGAFPFKLDVCMNSALSCESYVLATITAAQ